MDVFDLDQQGKTVLVLGHVTGPVAISDAFELDGEVRTVTAVDNRGSRERSCLTGQLLEGGPQFSVAVVPSVPRKSLRGLHGVRISARDGT